MTTHLDEHNFIIMAIDKLVYSMMSHLSLLYTLKTFPAIFIS